MIGQNSSSTRLQLKMISHFQVQICTTTAKNV
jgi:hypothetical protein